MNDEGDVRVYVDPSASHYHAGETATFTISFTNIQTGPVTGTPQAARTLIPRTRSEDQITTYGRSRGHRRAASSVSEARMARPPTSPGLRRLTPPTLPKYTPLTPSSLSQPSTSKKGLIGATRHINGGPRPNSTPSLSIVVTQANAFRDINGSGGTTVLNGSDTPATPTKNRSSPPRRSRTTNGIPISHPHARKQSAALDGTFPLVSSHIQRVPPTTPSTASFSASLPPITESNSIENPASSAVPPDSRSSLGHGNLRRAPELSVRSTTPFNVIPPTSLPESPCTPSPIQPNDNSALILLAHAQVTGFLTLEPPSAALAASWRAAELGVGRRVVGGGRVGIGVAHPRVARPRATSGVGAWLGISSSDSNGGTSMRAALGLGGLASADSSTASLVSAPPDSPATRPFNPAKRKTHQRASSMASFIPGMSSISALLGPFGEDGDSLAADDRPRSRAGGRGDALGAGTVIGGGGGMLDVMSSMGTVEQGVYPIIESQPSVLAVDLTLQPGEARQYKYSISLPPVLPPSFRGKHFRLTYYLVIGTTRPDAQADAGQLRRVIRVPIRMYSYVAVGQIPRPYDLMWPLARRREGAVLVGTVEDIKNIPTGPGRGRVRPSPSSPPIDKDRLTRAELESYARKLIIKSNPNTLAAEINNLRLSPGGLGANEDELEAANMSCRDAVEVVTRHSKKVSYDIAKDGKTVAVITFVKGAYRLGETVLGVIELNNPAMDGQVLKASEHPAYSATLESTESLALHTPAPQTRKHAEHHVAFAVGTQRAAFSLVIPSDASPSFVIRAGDTTLNGQNGVGKKTMMEGGLQWHVRMVLVVCMTPSARARYVIHDGPGNDWGESWRAAGELAPLGPADPNITNTSGEGWGSFFGRWTGDEEGAATQREEGWAKLKPETIECELPITVFPGSTAYQPSGFDTWA